MNCNTTHYRANSSSVPGDPTLTDGEDYELVFALAARADRAAFARAWRRAFPRTPLTCIGQFVKRGAQPPGALNLDDYRGFEHLR